MQENQQQWKRKVSFILFLFKPNKTTLKPINHFWTETGNLLTGRPCINIKWSD